MPETELDPQLLSWLKDHQPSESVRRQAEANGLDLSALKKAEPLTYAAISAAPLVRTDARLEARVGTLIARLFPHHQLFDVPLTLLQTNTELRIFPSLTRGELATFDDALAQLTAESQDHLFYRTVEDKMGERRELAWPLAPAAWREGPAFVGPFTDEAAASSWGQENADPRTGLVYDTLPYAGAWFCDVFRGD